MTARKRTTGKTKKTPKPIGKPATWAAAWKRPAWQEPLTEAAPADELPAPQPAAAAVAATPPDEYVIGNDTPVWMRPRRTVYFILRNGEIVNDAAGRRRYFESMAEAERAMERIKSPVAATPPDNIAAAAPATAAVCCCCKSSGPVRERGRYRLSSATLEAELAAELIPTCLEGVYVCGECEGQFVRQTVDQMGRMIRRGRNDVYPLVKVVNRWQPTPEQKAAAEAAKQPTHTNPSRRRWKP